MPLEAVAPLVRRPVAAEVAQAYPIIAARSFGRGTFHQPTLEGERVTWQRLFQVRAGDLLVSNIKAWEGAVAVVPDADDGMYCSHRYLTCVADVEQVLPAWLGWFFNTPTAVEQLAAASPGSADRNRTLSMDGLRAVKVPLPPLVEQRRIVARIDALAAKIAEARGLREEAVKEVEALIAGAIDGYFSPASGWRGAAVGDLCEHPQYGFTAPSTRDPIGPKLLRITDIQDGHVDWDGVPYCQCPEPANYLLRDGDLVFARTGGTTGKSFIIRECPTAVFASYLIRLRPKDSVLVEYLHWFFQSRRYWQQIAEGVQGTGQPNLNGTKLAGLSVPLAPMDEQHRIVAELEALQAKVDAVKLLQAATATELDALLPAILDRAFKGEL